MPSTPEHNSETFTSLKDLFATGADLVVAGPLDRLPTTAALWVGVEVEVHVAEPSTCSDGEKRR